MNETRDHLRHLIRTMADFQTNLAIDAFGHVWALGKWYGEIPHFRRNFGHWSEMVLNYDDPIFLTLEPWVQHREPTDDERAWGAFYLNFGKETT